MEQLTESQLRPEAVKLFEYKKQTARRFVSLSHSSDLRSFEMT